MIARTSIERSSVKIMVLCLYLLFAASGATQASPLRSSIAALLIHVMIACAATYWCVVDSRIMGRPIVQSIHWIMFFTWPISAPIYLIYSRGLRGLGFAMLHAIGLLVVFAICLLLDWIPGLPGLRQCVVQQGGLLKQRVAKNTEYGGAVLRLTYPTFRKATCGRRRRRVGLVDGMNHQRRAANRVAGGEHAWHAAHPVVDRHIAASVEFDAEAGHQALVAT